MENGQPVTKLVPMIVHEQWKKNRALFFEKLHKAQAQANLPAEEAATVAQDAIGVIRSARVKVCHLCKDLFSSL